MLHLKGALIGIAAFVGLVLGLVIAAVYMGFAPMAADSTPSSMEASLAMKAVHAVSEREMGSAKDPLRLSEANLASGLKTYQQNCLLCHGASDGKPSNAAAGFYAPSPQFATDGAEDDPEGATFWKIHHGIRFTAMPAFHKTLDDTQIWQVAMFLKNMDRLPKQVSDEWKATPSVGGAQSRTMPKMSMK